MSIYPYCSCDIIQKSKKVTLTPCFQPNISTTGDYGKSVYMLLELAVFARANKNTLLVYEASVAL